MGIFRRLFGRDEEGCAVDASAEEEAPSEGVSYRELLHQLASASEQTRHDTAMLLSALGHRGAIRPLIRTYLTYGDDSLLDALAAFGPKVTMVAARESRDLSLGPSRRARLMTVLGVTGDPGAVTLVLPLADDPDVRVHVAACGALARLGDSRGVDRLADDLFRFDPELRSMALAELQELDLPEADAAIEDYVQRYLGGGGAVPADVRVSLPLLIDREADLVTLIADHVGGSALELTVVTGPAMDSVSEGHRDALESRLPGREILFVTQRHSADERARILRAARQNASSGRGRAVVLVGYLPSPGSARPTGHFLSREPRADYSARLVLVGPKRFALVMEWWKYLADKAEVPTELEVVLTDLVLGGSELTSEELALYHLAGDARRDAYARAFLAQL